MWDGTGVAARRSTRALVVIVTLAALVAAVPGASAAGVARASAPSFEDVPSDSTFATSITWLAQTGITRGCNPPTNDLFCPDDNVTRGQFAAFFDRALDLPDAPERFDDVGPGNVFAANIGALAASGITRGCNPPANDRFCPDDHVTRGQFAAFLDRALDLPDAPERFDDVGPGNVFAANIGALAASGITRGCNPPTNDRFCPDDLLTRAQLAAFLHRASDTPQWPDTAPPANPPEAVVGTILAAGDIADCPDNRSGAVATADLLEARMRSAPDAVVAPLGDLAYDDGTEQEFSDCYDPTWGRFVDRSRPALGNHDVTGPEGAAPYFRRFGAAAGPEPAGYYSYELGDWLVVVLNSNCAVAGGCGEASDQVAWLRRTLAAADTGNIVAYWHHPRWTTGFYRDEDHEFMDVAWETLADAGADVVLSGHDHNYQRYAPLDAAGTPDPAGMRQFVVGTGGTNLRPREFRDDARAQEQLATDLGVLELTLEACGYAWRFHTVSNGVMDSGRTNGTC